MGYDFPRLVYVGDVPVEASYHGSALLHRLLADYPPGKLTILETATQSQPGRRLPNVNYISQPIGKQRWLNTRFHPYAVAWFTQVAPRMATKISESLNGCDCEGVLTVVHGFGWLTAAEIASKRKVPLHLMVHDDWPRVADVAPPFQMARRSIPACLSPGSVALLCFACNESFLRRALRRACLSDLSEPGRGLRGFFRAALTSGGS